MTPQLIQSGVEDFESVPVQACSCCSLTRNKIAEQRFEFALHTIGKFSTHFWNNAEVHYGDIA